MSAVRFQRVSAGDIRVGDRVARSRSHEFREVLAISRLVVSVRLHFAGGALAIPRMEAQWWRELTPVAFTGAPADLRIGPPAS